MARSKKTEFKAPQIVVIALDDTSLLPNDDFGEDVIHRSGGKVYGVYFYDANRVEKRGEKGKESDHVALHFLRFEPGVEPRETSESLLLESQLAELAEYYEDEILDEILSGDAFWVLKSDLVMMLSGYKPIIFDSELVTPSNEDEYDELMGMIRDVLESNTDISPLKAARTKPRIKRKSSGKTMR